MEKPLILLSNRPDDLHFCEKVATFSGLNFQHAATIKEAIQMIKEQDRPVIFVDVSTLQAYQEFEAAVQSHFGLYSSKISVNRIHYLSSAEISEVPYLIKSPIFGNYIHRNALQSSEPSEYYGRIVQASLTGKAFGLECLIKPNTKIQSLDLTHSHQKRDAVEAVRKYLVDLKFQTRMADLIANAIDELIMNAIFDAPVDSTGRHIYDSTARNTAIELKGRAAVRVDVAFDGTYVVFTVVDQFGSLDKTKLLNAISAAYRQQEYRVRTSVAGAGIGLSTIFSLGGSFHFASESSVKTEVSVFFQKTSNFKEFKDQFRFLVTQFYF